MKTPIRLFAVILLAGIAASAHAQAPASDLWTGSRGQDVVMLQQELISAKTGISASSLASAGATGYFGSLTRAALAEYQLAYGISPAQGYFGPKTRAYLNAHGSSTTTPATGQTYSGKLESVDTSCFSDGICSATVGGKKVIIVSGMRLNPPPVGSLKGVDSIGDLEGKIGSTITVYAATSTMQGYDYTLYGSSDYYLEVTDFGKTVSYTGTIGCRAAKDTSGPVIALCSFGLKTDAGEWYALRTDGTSQDVYTYSDGKRVTVTGTTAPAPNDSFKANATIDVTKITKA